MKNVLSAITALLLVLSLTACSDAQKKGPEYERNADGQGYTLIRYGASKGEDVVVPDTYEGLPVTAIASGAFYEQFNMKSVVIPEGVTTIGEKAFFGCAALMSVTLPNSLTKMGACAFQDCSSLTSIVIPEGITTLENGVFLCCTALSSVVLPEGLKSINDQAFDYCESLQEITIPDGVETIGLHAFGNCKQLRSATIPDSVSQLHMGAFDFCESLKSIYLGAKVSFVDYGETTFHEAEHGQEIHGEILKMCPSVESIEVSENNPNYRSIDGNLFSKDGTQMVRYAVGKKATSYTVPDSVTTILDGAFNVCSLLESNALENVTISKNVTNIGQSVFIGCSALKNIYFDGTMEQWDQAKEDTLVVGGTIIMEDKTIDMRTITGDYGSFVIHCTDGDVSGDKAANDN